MTAPVDAYRVLCSTFGAEYSERGAAHFEASLRASPRHSIARALNSADVRFATMPSPVVFASFVAEAGTAAALADPHLRSLEANNPYERVARLLEGHAMSRRARWPPDVEAEFKSLRAQCNALQPVWRTNRGGGHGESTRD